MLVLTRIMQPTKKNDNKNPRLWYPIPPTIISPIQELPAPLLSHRPYSSGPVMPARLLLGILVSYLSFAFSFFSYFFAHLFHQLPSL